MMDIDSFLTEREEEKKEEEVEQLAKDFVRFKLAPDTMATKRFLLMPDTNEHVLQQLRKDFGNTSDLEEEDDCQTDEEEIHFREKSMINDVLQAVEYFNKASLSQKKELVENFKHM